MAADNLIFNHFDTLTSGTGATKTKDLTVASGETVIINAVDFTAPSSGPANDVYMKLEIVGVNILSAARGDKFVLLSNFGYPVEGPATIRSTLTKSPGGSVDVGLVMYYEKL